MSYARANCSNQCKGWWGPGMTCRESQRQIVATSAEVTANGEQAFNLVLRTTQIFATNPLGGRSVNYSNLSIDLVFVKCTYMLAYGFKFLRAVIGSSGDWRRGTRGSFVVLASVAAALLWCSQFFLWNPCAMPFHSCQWLNLRLVVHRDVTI